MKWLGLVLLLVFAGCDSAQNAADQARESADAAKGAASEMAESASEKMGSMSSEIMNAGMTKLAEMKGQLLERAVGVLGEIEDTETAQAALPKLQEVAANIGAMKERLSEMGGEAMGSLSGGGDMSALDSQLARLDSMPEVKAIVEKPLEAIVSFFKG
jgi:hypothetical protein